MTDTNKPLDPKHEKLLKTRGRGSGKDYEPFIKVHEMNAPPLKMADNRFGLRLHFEL